ncbi:GntR family transcriptional regulator [Labrys sp. KNU-23]|uniref:GntR family transcriptional regulator n=1 Tax=Labrys sp. KNU-23 TaxID=2789216 RepID=UPI0011EBA7E9|nr:GntR family transcriptional regulator [Labrys sp. KNU-23]QEN88981.1 GntR family transcriptional regulator [Labrys sp. KNU-23]
MSAFATFQDRTGGRPLAAQPGMTTSALVHRALRDEIVSMIRLPGEKIAEAEVAAAHSVSRTPVREALLRLADEGLVEIAARSATRVALIPAAILPDAIFVRSAVEHATARAAAHQARGSSVTLLRGLIERQRESLGAGDTNGFHEADEAFHAALAMAAGRPGAWEMVQQVKTQLDRYRRLTLPEAGRMLRVVDEHGAIVDAIEAHDAEKAGLAMDHHLDGLRRSLASIRDHNPDYFSGDAAGISAAFETLLFR